MRVGGVERIRLVVGRSRPDRAADASTLLAAPIAVQEMVFAAYLIVKGFKAPEVAGESA